MARIREVLPFGDLIPASSDAENRPDSAMRGWVSCLGDTDASTIGSSKATWLNQCDV